MPTPLILIKLNDEKKLALQFPMDDDFNKLEQELSLISAIEKEKKLSGEGLLVLRLYKLSIFTMVERKLKELNNEVIVQEEEKPENGWSQFLKKSTYWFLLSVGLIMDGIGAFLGMKELLGLIPFLANPTVIGLSLFLSFVNCAMFYSFEAGMLRESLGLNSLDELNLLLNADRAEVDAVDRINQLIRKLVTVVPQDEFKKCSHVVNTINVNILDKKAFFEKEIKEKTSEKYLRHGITVIGALMVSAGSYFMMGALLGAVGATLIGTPIGWGLIGLGIATNLCYFLTMRGKAMVSMQNPVIYKHREMKVRLDKFNAESEEGLNNLHDEKIAVRNQKQIISKLEKHNHNLKNKLVLEVHLADKLYKPRPIIVEKSYRDASLGLFDLEHKLPEKDRVIPGSGFVFTKALINS